MKKGIQLKLKLKNKTKECKKCHKELELDNFYKRSESEDGRQPWCKECMITYNKSRKQEKELLGLIDKVNEAKEDFINKIDKLQAHINKIFV